MKRQYKKGKKCERHNKSANLLTVNLFCYGNVGAANRHFEVFALRRNGGDLNERAAIFFLGHTRKEIFVAINDRPRKLRQVVSVPIPLALLLAAAQAGFNRGGEHRARHGIGDRRKVVSVVAGEIFGVIVMGELHHHGVGGSRVLRGGAPLKRNELGIVDLDLVKLPFVKRLC